jgi:hypothetical protein
MTMPIDATEDIAKAICSDKFDAVSGEVSASLFKGSGSSVSRLSLCPLEETWEMFRQRVEKPPLRILERIGVINVGHLVEVGQNFENNPTTLTVEAVPLEGYLSHAEIAQKISRGLSNEIVKHLNLKQES